jgi:hypothetical protein
MSTEETATINKDDWLEKPTTELFGLSKRKPNFTKPIEGYTPTLVRSDVFERIKELQKQQQPRRIGAKEIVTFLLKHALNQPETVSNALREARFAAADELQKEIEQLKQD